MANGKNAINFVLMTAGVLSMLSIGFAMTNGTLVVPYISSLSVIAGWVIVIATVIGTIMAIADGF